MGLEHISEKLMGMSDEVWKRHANPWSGWSRLTALPLIALAAWSRLWIGDLAWFVGFFVLIWIWLNPRLFAVPESTDNWMSKGVLGERLWIKRAHVPIPDSFRKKAMILIILSALGMIPFIAGLIWLNSLLTLFGMVVVMVSKLYFLEVMVRLYELSSDNS